MINRERCLDLLKIICNSMNNHGVEYKIFGGMVVTLYNSERLTNDADISLFLDNNNVEKFIWSLVSIGFGAYEDIYNQIWGFDGKKYMESTCHLESTNAYFKDFHIDLMFNIGQHSYNTLKSDLYNLDGVIIHTLLPIEIIRMKANIIPRPRQKDIEDIIFLADMLGLDPATGKPLMRGEKRGTKKSIREWFSRRNNKRNS